MNLAGATKFLEHQFAELVGQSATC